MNEKEVDLRDFIFEVLLHWRSIILCIFIGAIFFTACSFLQLHLSDKKAQTAQSSELTPSELEKNMTQAERTAVDQVLLNEDSCQKWEAYIEKSALMKLDTSKVYQSDLVYAVNTPKNPINPTAVYFDLLATNDIYKFISNKIDSLTMNDAQELIHVLNPSSFSAKQENCSFRITAIAATKKKCKALSNAIQEYIDKLHSLVADTYGAHDITLLQNSTSGMDSTALLQEQIDMRNKITLLNTETANLINNFSEIQTQYYQLRTSDDNASSDFLETKDKETPTTIQTLTRSALWGIVFAVIIYMFTMFFLYITNSKLRYTDDYIALYQIPVLGHIPSKRKPRTLFRRIDFWLYCKRDKRLYTTPVGQAIRLASTALLAIAQKKSLAQIYGISCGPISVSLENEIKNLLSAANIGFGIIDNILYDADSIQMLCKVQDAVLIEKTGSVKHDEFQQSLGILQQQNINVIGMILIE